jgi:hypothetical protein
MVTVETLSPHGQLLVQEAFLEGSPLPHSTADLVASSLLCFVLALNAVQSQKTSNSVVVLVRASANVVELISLAPAVSASADFLQKVTEVLLPEEECCNALQVATPAQTQDLIARRILTVVEVKSVNLIVAA